MQPVNEFEREMQTMEATLREELGRAQRRIARATEDRDKATRLLSALDMTWGIYRDAHPLSLPEPQIGDIDRAKFVGLSTLEMGVELDKAPHDPEAIQRLA